MFTVGTVITAFLYLRCCCFLSSDCLIRAVNIQLNAGAGRKLLIWGERGLTCVEFKYYVIKLFCLCDCNFGLFAAGFM